jgi:hypothetical protein
MYYFNVQARAELWTVEAGRPTDSVVKRILLGAKHGL